MNQPLQINDNTYVREHLISRLHATDAKLLPFPHAYVTRCFPQDYYEEMRKNLPADEVYTDRKFDNRMMCNVHEAGPFWQELYDWLMTNQIISEVLTCFPMIRIPKTMNAELRLVRDLKGYKIKPHTDIKSKFMSLLFYLPGDESFVDAGTTLMKPKEEGFTSDGNRRYEFEDFVPVFTAPFAPNTMLMFPRSPVSFHGVEPISMAQRDVMLLNLYHLK